MGADNGLHDEVVQGFISSGGSWVFWSAHVFVMSLKVLVKEVRVHEFSVSPSSGNFVDHFSLVEELVPSDSVEATEVAPLKAEQEVLTGGLWLKFEPVAVNINVVAHHDEGPNPSYGFKNIETVKWDPKSFVVEKCSLTFLS